MAIAQAILDAQTRLNAAVAANSDKVDQLLARPAADPNAATPAEQQTIADTINQAASTVEAINAKS